MKPRLVQLLSRRSCKRFYSSNLCRYFASEALPPHYKPLECLTVPEYDERLKLDAQFIQEKLDKHPLPGSLLDPLIPRLLFETNFLHGILSNMSHSFDLVFHFFPPWCKNMEYISMKYFDEDPKEFEKLLSYVEKVEEKDGIQSQLLQFFWNIIYPVQVTNPERMKWFFGQINILFDFEAAGIPEDFASRVLDYNWLLRYLRTIFYCKQCKENASLRQQILQESATLEKEVREDVLNDQGIFGHNFEMSHFAEAVAKFYDKSKHSINEFDEYFQATSKYLKLLPVDRFSLYFMMELIATSKDQISKLEWKWESYEKELEKLVMHYYEVCISPLHQAAMMANYYLFRTEVGLAAAWYNDLEDLTKGEAVKYLQHFPREVANSYKQISVI